MPTPVPSRQTALPFHKTFSPRRVAKPKPRVEQQNEAAAAIILSDPARYGGSRSLMGEWARLVRGKAGA